MKRCEINEDTVRGGVWLLWGSVSLEHSSEDFKRYLVSSMRKYDIIDVINRDKLIIQLENSKLEKLGIGKAKEVRGQIGQCARVLIQIRKSKSELFITMYQVITPENFKQW